jgi:hydrogenase maturation protein HypF
VGSTFELKIPMASQVNEGRRRFEICFSGAVQGVGFRPSVYRLAVELGLSGQVANTAQGVQVEIEGFEPSLNLFLKRFPGECPPLAQVLGAEVREIPPKNETDFQILKSHAEGRTSVTALPDAAICPECLREIFDPTNRRYRYPFTNCTYCGPRFSILLGLPYDRERTTMRNFPMCPDCRAEYENPSDRRFHAQPVACPVCGPQLSLWDPDGRELCVRDEALKNAARALREGKVLALKGLGGFQLLCDAGNATAVESLRRRKHREEKPFAVMFPNLDAIRSECILGEEEEAILASPASPILLLKRGQDGFSTVAASVAPGNPNLGVFLPTTPLHALLLFEVGVPLVATSGNLTDEPIVTDEKEALRLLEGAADLFLVHNRPIARSVDDSVVRVMADRPVVLRRARGYAPRPVVLQTVGEGPSVLAVGGHLKSCVTFLSGDQAMVGQHIGDLETPRSLQAFQKSANDLPGLYDIPVDVVACDAHPDYASTRYAESLGKPLVRVQHHAAHLASCAAENAVAGEALGVSWDGTGWGPDGTVWGGEFFTGQGAKWTRRGRLRPFRLPGGEAAVREPRRSALGVLFELEGAAAFERNSLATLGAFTEEERRVLKRMLENGTNCPWTSSVGRLFDAVSSILNLHQRIDFEGQGAMAVEFAASETEVGYYPVFWEGTGELQNLNWGGMVQGILKDLGNNLDKTLISAKFQNSLVEGVIKATEVFGQNKVLLSGGCFQNKNLLESCARRLRESGLGVYWPREVPPNDGGLSLGQAVIARAVYRADLSKAL